MNTIDKANEAKLKNVEAELAYDINTTIANYKGLRYLNDITFEEKLREINGVDVEEAYTIKNLSVKDSYIVGKIAAGGIVTASRGGTIENCHNINTRVEAKQVTAGGVVGQSTNTLVKDCTNTGEIVGGKNSGNNGGQLKVNQ